MLLEWSDIFGHVRTILGSSCSSVPGSFLCFTGMYPSSHVRAVLDTFGHAQFLLVIAYALQRPLQCEADVHILADFVPRILHMHA